MAQLQREVEKAGGVWLGFEIGVGWFNDPVTKSTMVAVDGDDEYTLRRRIKEKREQFAKGVK